MHTQKNTQNYNCVDPNKKVPDLNCGVHLLLEVVDLK